ncbi:MAG: response regulator [Anaerolineae bacterium]|nr:response regulator [Anaerolineae bacterium]
MISPNPQEWIVLIVDDEPDNLRVAQRVLLHQGSTVYAAENGQEGLAVVAQVRPNFILLDLSMPKMDGWEMFRRLRAEPSTADIPVIALTAHAMEDDRQRATEAGFDGYITKPFRLVSFLEDIRAALQPFITP